METTIKPQIPNLSCHKECSPQHRRSSSGSHCPGPCPGNAFSNSLASVATRCPAAVSSQGHCSRFRVRVEIVVEVFVAAVGRSVVGLGEGVIGKVRVERRAAALKQEKWKQYKYSKWLRS